MSWALFAREALRRGETVQVKPRGHSMRGKVDDGDIVLARVGGRDYLHLVKAIDNGWFQIGNNRGGINGWVGPNGIYGKAVRVEAPG